MNRSTAKLLILAAGVLAATTGAVGALTGVLFGVPAANPRSGVQPNVLMDGLALRRIAQGGELLENASGLVTSFGYLNDGPLTVPPTPPPDAGTVSEATKTEPDENTYLVLDHNPGGPTQGYDYGRHFLFQGHENSNGMAYVTRINLDVHDADHRITLLTPVDPQTKKTGFTRIDGSSYNPFTNTLLLSQENGNLGGIFQVSVDWPPVIQTLYGSLGQGGYEGVHPDDWGNIHIAEDVGGTSVGIDPAAPTANKFAKNPNSFIYRFVPEQPGDLTKGKLQALQVTIDGEVINFVPVAAATPTGDVHSARQKKLYDPTQHWDCKWVTLHDTAVDGTTAFDANAAAKAKNATPFKRPENLQFIPGRNFRSFVFTVTGDTDKRSGDVSELAARGAWGALMRVDLDHSRNTGKIGAFVVGDAERAAFDNLTFASEDLLLVGEDRGDNLHKQLNALDSIWGFNLHEVNPHGFRLLALGRDIASTTDSAYLEFTGIFPAGFVFQNDGDNEATGLIASDGNATVEGLLGRRLNPHDPDVRTFFTQQHGLNQVFEIVRKHGHHEE